MNLSHQQARKRIQEALDDPARLPNTDPALTHHLAGCPACQSYLRQMAELDAQLTHYLPQASPLPHLSEREMHRRRQKVQDRIRRNTMLAWFPTALRRAAAAAVLIAATFALIWVIDNLRPQQPPAAQPYSVSATPTMTAAPTPAAIIAPVPSATPLPAAPTALPEPELAVYQDADGQLTLEYPSHWTAAENGALSGEDGFVRVSYLPGQGYAGAVSRVCEAFANTPQGPARSIQLYSIQEKYEACLMLALDPQESDRIEVIVQNPTTNPIYRFIEIEVDQAHLEPILGSLEFTHSAPWDATLEPPPAAYSGDGPFGAGDGVPNWPPTAPVPAGLTIEEHAVVDQSEDSPTHIEFLQRIPDAVREKRRALREGLWEQRLASVNAALQPFGYVLRGQEASEEQPVDLYQLSREDEVLLEDIHAFWPISVSASGQDFALTVEKWNGGCWLVQRDTITQWDMAASMFTPPILVGEDLLAVTWEEPSLVKVKRGEETIYAFASYFMVSPPVKGFWSWDGHWILEVDGFIIQDGAILNTELGYAEMFGWQTLAGKPFYYFRAGDRIGLSYDGQVLPVSYSNLIHYQCCEPAAFNAGGNEKMVWFYALRDEVWHYVEAGFFP